MLEKEIVTDKIEILEDGTIQTREVTRIIEDGEIISQSFTNSILSISKMMKYKLIVSPEFKREF